MNKNIKGWLKAAGIRAVKTVAQTAAASIGAAAIISDVNWVVVLSASALAGVLSYSLPWWDYLKLRPMNHKIQLEMP